MSDALHRRRVARLFLVVPVAALLLLAKLADEASAEVTWWVEAEAGIAGVQYNNVRIPGDDGTRIRAASELSFNPLPFVRLRAGLRVNDEHVVGLLGLPFQYNSWGELPRDTLFRDLEFPEGEFVRLAYRFNSWRITYRYEGIQPSPDLRLGIGFTAKLRDAAISLEGDSGRREKTDLGFVPLLNLYLRWQIDDEFGLRFELDGLAAPQGRAFDGIVAAFWRPAERVELYLGYRALEGGADNDDVFTFAYFHFATLGITLTF